MTAPEMVGGRDARSSVRARFAAGDTWFASSPLYQVLARRVVQEPELLDLAALTRPGQQPANMLMAATHLTVLEHPGHPFARFFPTVVGDEALAPEAAGGQFGAFCAEHREVLTRILRTRLVQTNEPARGVALRLALHEVARRVHGPVALLEVGASAGIQLRFDRWAVVVAGRQFGPARAPVRLRAEWRGDLAPPDLDALPEIRERLGVDLDPVDVTSSDERRWLQALVWPEHRDRFAVLTAALDELASCPPDILRGDAIDLLPRLDAQGRLPGDIPLVVCHAMVRLHVPGSRRGAFDAAIRGLARGRRVFHVALEPSRSPWVPEPDGHPLTLWDSADPGRELAVAAVEGHGRWIRPLPGAPPVQ